MEEVFSGAVCGFTWAIIATLPLAVWALKARQEVPFLKTAVPEGMSLAILTIPLASFFFPASSALGIVFGMLLIAAKDAHTQSGLGSPNLMYTLIVLITAFMLFFPFFALVRSARRLTIFLAFVFVALFGWLTPYLAQYAVNHVS